MFLVSFSNTIYVLALPPFLGGLMDSDFRQSSFLQKNTINLIINLICSATVKTCGQNKFKSLL